MRMTLQERFENQYIPIPEVGCWIWTGAIDKDGYGYIKESGKTTKAHRVSYKLHFKVSPGKNLVCHFCDTPSCVNPNHLFLGTPQSNMTDKMKKHRHKAGFPDVKGDKNPNRILSTSIVTRLRSLYKRGDAKYYAKVLGVSPECIRRAIRGVTWK